MKQKSERTLTPKLRFPEFREAEAWSLRKLSDFLVERKQRNRQLKYDKQDVLSVSGERGCVNQIELLGRSYAGVSVKEYHIVETGDIVYTKSPLKLNPYGIIKENKGKPGIVSTLYAVYHTTAEGHPVYFEHYFSRDYNLNSYLQPIVRKGAKNDMKVNNYAVLGGKIFVPKLKEQQKIAECLGSLDGLIAAEGRKLAALRDHKRGLMQQLFPQPGETQRRLRFPEFRDKGEWVEKALVELVKFSSGGTPSKTDTKLWDGDIPWISASGMHDTVVYDSELKVTQDAIGNGTRLAAKGSILILVRGSMLFKRVPICIAERDVAFNQDVKSIRPKRGVVTRYLLYHLIASESRIVINATGIGAGKIDTEHLNSLIIGVPSSAEQQKIADCLSALDAWIAAQAAKIESLKQHKRGLMQQLFPSPEEIES